MKNPLLDQDFSHDTSYIAFPEIKDEHFAPAFAAGIEEAKKNLETLANSDVEATFQNTIEGIEFHRETLDRVSTIFFNLSSAHTNDFIKAYAKEISPKLSELSNDLILNPKIFARVKSVYEKRAKLNLNTEQAQLLDKTYKAFCRNGALLSETQKQSLRSIDQRLSILGTQFSENVLNDTNGYLLVIRDEKELAGIPAAAREAAKALAEEKKEANAWAFNLQFPSFFPLLQYGENALRRQQIWKANSSRATKGAYNNQPILHEIARLRFERAKLLGYENHAAFVLEERMAGNPQRVKDFLQDILKQSKPAAEKDFQELKALKKEITGEENFFPWDNAFYTEKLKERKFAFSSEELRPYFKLENVIQGVFDHATKLYGLHFEENKNIPVYHPDVKVFEVKDESDGRFIGLFYADFFPRDSKRGGAWMTSFREQGVTHGKKLRPQVSIVCNFTKPTATQPSLLTLDEVKTLFHEFGHALHGLLSDCHYPSLAGPNVYWDFVELPSQVMENWVTQKESLALFAKHYQSGEVLPDALIEKVKKAETFQAGYFGVRQLSLGLLDMAWHSIDPSNIHDVEEFELTSVKEAQFFPHTPGTSTSASFSHIFAGGYSAGYYSYKWAEVLDADAFEFFLDRGIFNKEVAKAFREHVLSRGGTEHPMELYKRFRGREPDPKALLRREGLIAN